MTGGEGRSLRLWSAVGVAELKLPGEHNSMRQGGLTMEDEMILDGAVVCAAFDETLDMVGNFTLHISISNFITASSKFTISMYTCTRTSP